MAVDHALLESVQHGARPTLRLYRWRPACLSFGRNQQARDVYEPCRARAAGFDIARRPTGGLAVLHDRELTYSVTAPLQPFGGPRAAYAAINRALVEGLRLLGVPAVLAPAGPRRASFTAAQPCFQTTTPGEVVVGGRKLIGSAQRAERSALLQHGSILLDGSQSDVLRLLAAGAAPAPVEVGSITVRELLGRVPTWDELASAIVSGFMGMCGTRLAPETLTRSEAACAAALEDHYRAETWTWRR